VRRGTLTEERKAPVGSASKAGYECCFCGKSIEPHPPDVCVLLLRTALQENRTEPSQELFCHATCLKERLRPGIPTVL
jgi:hypothetical protein